MGTWQRLAHVALSSAASSINSGTFTAKNNIKIVFSGVGTNGSSYPRIRFNSDTGNNYVYRQSADGGSDNTQTSQNHINTTGNVGAFQHYFTAEIANISGEEKLIIVKGMDSNTSGAGNAPRRREVTGKWVTKTGQITSVQVTDLGSHNFAAGAYLTVFGASGDITTDEKDSLTNVSAGTRYEETDTRKIYRATNVEPKFHYKFDESSGDVINHGSVGTSANLTVTGLTRDVSSPSGIGDGMSGAGIGGGDYATNTEVNSYKFLHDGSSWSITYWSQMTELPTSSTTETFIFGNVWTDDQGTGLMVRTSYVSGSSGAALNVVAAANNNSIPLNVTTDNLFIPDTTNWHFYALTFDGTTLTMQRDNATTGAGYKTGDKSGNAFNTGNPTRKPTWFNRDVSQSDKAYGGKIAQFTIWDRVLTADEKTSLYASGNGTTTLPSPLEWKERGSA